MTVAQRTISTGKVAVIGFGVTGESVVRHLLAHSKEVVVLDTRPERAVDAQGVDIVWECRHWPDIDVDYAVLSPGLVMDSCLVASARNAGVQLCSDIDLFFGGNKKIAKVKVTPMFSLSDKRRTLKFR